MREKTLPLLLERLDRAFHELNASGEIIVVNDGSTDNTAAVATVPVYDKLVGKLVDKLDRGYVNKNSREWWLNLFTEEGYEAVKWISVWRYYFKNIFNLHRLSKIARSQSPAIFIISQIHPEAGV